MTPREKARIGLSHLEEAILDTLFQAGDTYISPTDISHKIGVLPSYDYGSNPTRIVRQILDKMKCDGRVEPRETKNRRNIEWRLTREERNQYADISSSKTIDDIIDEIKRKSADGDYLYRGERKQYKKVSSALYREYVKIINVPGFDLEQFDFIDAQKELLKFAKNHIREFTVGPLEHIIDIGKRKKKSPETGFGDMILELISETIENAAGLEILTELQHYGGETNLIDFTTDYFIAIFFACSGHPKKAGRVILLEKNEKVEDMIIHPQNPRHRIIAQKSVFLQPRQGYIEVPDNQIVSIPADLKQPLLDYLETYHRISTQSIYNDIHGFIRYQNIHRNAYVQFYMGYMFHQSGCKAESPEKRQTECKKAIEHYNEAQKLNPNINSIYCNRGEVWLHLQEWGKAREDLTIAQNRGEDIVASFRNDYPIGVKEFEEKTDFELPSDIAEMLGGSTGDFVEMEAD